VSRSFKQTKEKKEGGSSDVLTPNQTTYRYSHDCTKEKMRRATAVVTRSRTLGTSAASFSAGWGRLPRATSSSNAAPLVSLRLRPSSAYPPLCSDLIIGLNNLQIIIIIIIIHVYIIRKKHYFNFYIVILAARSRCAVGAGVP